jgi:hypothetical protein
MPQPASGRGCKPWGQDRVNRSVIHSNDIGHELAAFDSRLGAQGRPQGLSLGKPLMSQAKMAFSTGAGGSYHYYQFEKKT